MAKLPSRFRRLDDALADLAIDGDSMTLCELDGFLTGILLCPEDILPAEWLPFIWNADGLEPSPFEDPVDAQWFADMVIARQKEIARDLARSKPLPIFDVDESNGELLWEPWIDGFDTAMRLRPQSWHAVAESGEAEEEAAGALARLFLLAEIVREECDLTSIEINAICDAAPRLIPAASLILYAWRARRGGLAAEPTAQPAKVGRNDPCPCGSGKKYKKCCGAN